MDNLAKKSDFRSAFEAGKREVENRRRPFSLVRTIASAVVLIAALEVNRWLAARFQLSGLDKTLLDGLAYFLVFSVLLLRLWEIPIKRKKT